MGSKYTTLATSGYNSSPPPDDGTQTAANLITWDKHKTKLSDPVKTLADSMNTALVSAFDYSVRQISASDSTVAGDHMRCVEIAPTVSAAVTVSLGDAATMTNAYRVFVKNSSTITQTIGRVTAGDKIDNVAANISIGSGEGIVLQVTTGANGYVTIARTGLPLTGGTVSGNLAVTGTLGVTGTSTLAATNLSANLTISHSQVGGDVLSDLVNTDNTSGVSHARQRIMTGGAAGGDAILQFSDTTNETQTNFATGIDNSTNEYKVSVGTALGTNDALTITTGRGLSWGTGTATFGQVVKRKTADETVTSSTALQNDDHLSLTVAANEEWVIVFDIGFAGNLAAHGVKVAVTVPSGSVDVSATLVGGGGPNAYGLATTSSGTAMDFTAASFPASSTGNMRIAVWVLNGATPGTVQLQWAQSTSSGTGLLARKGGQMTATRVA